MSDGSEIIGHKTYSDGHGRLLHEPLTRAEGDAIWNAAAAQERARAEAMPTEKDALSAFHQAATRLQELGWKSPIYCPKDGTAFDVIEVGSSGIHECFYLGDWPTGMWCIPCEGDIWPSRPALFKPRSTASPNRMEKPDGE